MSEVGHVRAELEKVGQGHLLRFYDDLPEPGRRLLMDQIASVDLTKVPGLVERFVLAEPQLHIPADPQAPITYAADSDWDRDRYAAIGHEYIGAGKIAAFLVAGGQGTRLGFDGPKGSYPATPVTKKPLFQVFAESIAAAQMRYRCTIPWYIMTSTLNDSATVAFFEEHNYFGLDPRNISFFPQGEVPSFDATTGKILLAEKSRIAMNPDGHGGSIIALARSGALDDMRSRGIEHISYFQVDNPLVKVIDPLFIGLHAAASDSSAEMSSKMIPKAYPEEKLGVLCSVEGRTQVIEYSDLPEALAKETLPDGKLKFRAGSIAVHMLGLDFVDHLNGSMGSGPGEALPFHRALKKVPHLDPQTGCHVDPAQPNAVKLERFVFDALPRCKSSIVLETSRAEEFAPIKNASGSDSPDSSKKIQMERAARWLEQSGTRVPRKPDGSLDCTIEISPITAAEADQLKETPRIDPGAEVVL